MDKLIDIGLSYVENECTLQRKIIDSARKKNNYDYERYTRLYRKCSERTDNVCTELLENEDVFNLLKEAEKVAIEKYGSDYENILVNFSSIIVANIQKGLIDSGNDIAIMRSYIMEEVRNIFHNLAIKKYIAGDNEMFDFISLNIFSSMSLRALMSSNMDEYLNKSSYNSDISYEYFELCNDSVKEIASPCYEHIKLLCGRGGSFLRNPEIRKNLEFCKLMLTACYIEAQKRGFDIQVGDRNINNYVMTAIKEVANAGEEYIKDYNVKKKERK